MNHDLEIAKKSALLPIAQIAESLGLQSEECIPFGSDKAKISLDILKRIEKKPAGKLVLVSAITPTPAGEGKTTVSIGLGDALSLEGKKTCICLREPSLGPVFGIKGGAAGGGHSQVLPMEDINLHFTGDLHAVTSANNLLCALIDNHIHHGNALNIDPRRITFKRCMDMNDRQLRHIICGLGRPVDGMPRQEGFDITAASEIMAVLCLATDLGDLKRRLGDITVGYTFGKEPVFAKDLSAQGAMCALLKDAICPNLVQTIGHTPVLMHGGPFANIAHGCNSLIATRMSMHLADYTVTEAGFGADLGAEKFLDIKCRTAGIWPDCVVIVATVRALKFHGGVLSSEMHTENVAAIKKGSANLKRHINNIRKVYGLPVVVAVNRFDTDFPSEIEEIVRCANENGARASVASVWADGGKGGLELAQAVMNSIPDHNTPARPYDYAAPIKHKIHDLVTKIYGGNGAVYEPEALRKIEMYESQGYIDLPICVAKTQYSFSDDPKKQGAPEDFEVTVLDVHLSSGAGFLVVLTAKIMTMPGLPKRPAANDITVDEKGDLAGLF
jgi:formate--tetrahydrofolate ligase